MNCHSRFLTAIFSIFWLAACGSGSPTPEQSESREEAADIEAPPVSQSADPAKLEALKAAIKSEPKVIDFVYDPHAVFQWTIGVKDDGSPRFGYAEYVCILINENELPTTGAKVRIVDYFKYMQTQGDARAASLGSVDCGTSQQMMP